MAAAEELMAHQPPESETTCLICDAEFLDPEDLNLHISQMHPTGIVQCHFCTKLCASTEDYAKHIVKNHIKILRSCSYCTKIFTDSVSMIKHEKKHHTSEANKFACSQCKEKFDYKFDLQEHELELHSNCGDGVDLSACLPLLSAYLNIKAITFIDSLQSSNTVYICTKCQFTSVDVGAYIEHLEIANCCSFACEMCCNVYKNKRTLRRHFKGRQECSLQTAKAVLTKKCNKCLKDINKKKYKDHVKKCMPIKCNHCDLPMNSMEELSEHQTKEHPMAISMQICQFCHKEFVGTVSLQKHIDRVHKGDFHLYKYTCTYCENPLYFKHPKALFGHYFSTHPDLKPYCCKICNEVFRPRKKFTLHIKLVHSSVGFVEFDERYHVFFTDKKSEKPFQPTSFFADQIEKPSLPINELQETDLQTDVPTDYPTDVQTDVEATPKQTAKPPKIRFKEERSKRKQANTFSDYVSQSEANQTENEENDRKGSKKQQRRGRKRKQKELLSEVNDTDLSDDEPLAKVGGNRRNRVSFRNTTTKSKLPKKAQKNLTCSQCQKYCYTYQNYKHHMSLHSKNDVKKCIKCSEEFNSKTALNNHISEKHSTSKLTETLKNLLERRKVGKEYKAPELSQADKFRRTIKRVSSAPQRGVATIKEVNEKLSVKNFIENFTPEETGKKLADIQSSISVKVLKYKVNKPPAIKMTKFKPKPFPLKSKLAMPVRYKDVSTEKTKVNVKLVNMVQFEEEPEYGDHDDYEVYEEEVVEKPEPVPDVAQEVMLEDSQQEQPKPTPADVPYRILLPKLPKDTKTNIRIAHLLPEAPYYKIVKMEDVINKPDQKKDNEPPKKPAAPEEITLPGGRKLVTVNPLAHLLGNTPIEKVVGAARKYYKPKMDNFEKAITKAMMKLEERPPRRAKKQKKTEPPNESTKIEPATVVEE